MPPPKLIFDTPPPRQHYRKNFLSEVIARADFDAPLPTEARPPSGFAEAIKSTFPISEPRKVVAREFLIGPKASKERTHETKEWQYFDPSRGQRAVLAPGHVLTATTNYSRFEPFLQSFDLVLGAALKSFPDRQIARLGLRYVNNISLPSAEPTNWSKYLRSELCSIFDLADNRSTVSRAFHVLEFNYDGASMRFQFGMHNPDHPAPIRRKLYTLDYDVYTDSLLDRRDIPKYLNEFHRKVNASFEQVVTDALREQMEPINDV